MYARLRLFDRTALEVEGGVYLHELGPELGVMFGEPKEKIWERGNGSMYAHIPERKISFTGSTSMYDDPTGLPGFHEYRSSPLMLWAGVPLLEMLIASIVVLWSNKEPSPSSSSSSSL